MKGLLVTDEQIDALSDGLGVERLTAKLLLSRGYDTIESAEAFLWAKLTDLADFSLYTGVREAQCRIKEAISNCEKIIIYGDYDCDGVCASTILSETIKAYGGDVDVYIPKRLQEGYGVNRDALERLAEEYYPDLIITVDCGITSREDISYCINELGIDVIVTDHHEPPEELPKCIVVNPHLDENKGLFTDYCGAGVAFMLVHSIWGIEFSARFLDVVAVATMGDVVPLKGDNRILVRFGLKKMQKSPCLGLKMMFESLGIKGKYTSGDVAYKIVPRINSLGRLGDAKRAISLFTETDYFVLSCLIKEMNDENLARRNLCDKIEREAIECAKPYLNSEKIIILYGNWHKGVLGIVSNRIAERFLRPTILFCLEDGVLKGSCRSIDGINIYELLSKFSHKFLQFGGHSQAAGLSMEAKEFEAFRDEISTFVKENYPDEVFLPKVKYDADITGVSIGRKFLVELESFEPFGEGNLEPVFHALEGEGKYHYTKSSTLHLTSNTTLGYSISAFYKGDCLSLLNSKAKKHCYYTLGINIFNDKEYNQAILKEVRLDALDGLEENDDEVVSYSKTANFPQNGAQLLDENEFYRIITQIYAEDNYGSLTVCFTKETYDKVKLALNEIGIYAQTYYGVNTHKNSINAIVYCPIETFDYSIYENVFFADQPLSYPDENGFDIYSIDAPCTLLKILQSFSLTREKIGEYFKALRSVLVTTKIMSVQSAILNLHIGEQALPFTLSWQILCDVGLLDKNADGIFYIKNIRTELTNSPLYCIINQDG